MTNPDPFRTYLDEVRSKLTAGMARRRRLDAVILGADSAIPEVHSVANLMREFLGALLRHWALPAI
jgi:hypothetical protein